MNDYARVRSLAAAGIAGVLLVCAGTVPSFAGNAARGQALAERWCTSCHVVNARGTGVPTDTAPPLPIIAANPKKTNDYLTMWLAEPHGKMPDLHLGKREIEDLVAYIDTLRPK